MIIITDKLVYTVLEIQELLGICRIKAYELVQAYEEKNMFPVKKVGKNYLVSKEGFHKWLNEI